MYTFTQLTTPTITHYTHTNSNSNIPPQAEVYVSYNPSLLHKNFNYIMQMSTQFTN